MVEKEQDLEKPDEVIAFLKSHYPPNVPPLPQVLQRLIDAQRASVFDPEKVSGGKVFSQQKE